MLQIANFYFKKGKASCPSSYFGGGSDQITIWQFRTNTADIDSLTVVEAYGLTLVQKIDTRCIAIT